MMQPLWNQTFRVEHPTTLKHRSLLAYGDFETAEHSTLSTNSVSERLESKAVELKRYKLSFKNSWASILMIPAFKKLTPA